MTNPWREHIKKTMVEMKAKSHGKTVMLKDVLKVAGKTYKKPNHTVAASTHGKTRKKRRSSSKKEKKGKKGKKSKGKKSKGKKSKGK